MIISKSTVRRASIYITFSNVSICSMWNNESVSKPQCCISCLSKHRLSRTQNTTKLIDLTWPGLTFIRTPDPKHTAPFHFMSRSKSGSITQFLLKEDHCRNRFILYMRFCSVSYSSVQSKIIIYFWAWEWLPLCLNEIASPPRFLFYFIFFFDIRTTCPMVEITYSLNTKTSKTASDIMLNFLSIPVSIFVVR